VKDRLSLRLQPSRDEYLTCLVCRQARVDLEVVYGISGGHASQGLHRRCIGRAEAIQGGRRLWRRQTTRVEETS